MKSLAMVVGAAALLAWAPAVRAAPISYTLNLGGGEVEGTFTFDNAIPSLISVHLAATGSPLFTVPIMAGAPNAACSATIGSSEVSISAPGSCFSATDSGDTEGLVIGFADLLSTTSDPIVDAGFVTAGEAAADDATGSAVPVPEPASLAIFGAGLMGLAFVRRKRQA